MEINWKTLEQRKPKHPKGYNMPYISCLVFACNPKTPQGGVFEVCRWDVDNNCWLDSDIRNNWLLQQPYTITHFCDEINNPFL